MNKSNLAILTLAAAILFAIVMYFLKVSTESGPVPAVSGVNDVSKSSKSKADPPEGSYKYKISDGSSVSYVALKKFFNKPEEYVTGTTDEVDGEGWFSSKDKGGFVSVNISINDLKTDNAKRDADVAALFIDKTVRFSADISDLNLQLGKKFSASVPGSITINQVRRNIVFDVTGVVGESGLTASGTSAIEMDDFNITPPSLVSVFTADNNLQLKFDISARRTD